MTLATSSAPCLFPGQYHDILFYIMSSNHGSRTSVILVAATVITAECEEFWQLLLCQGFLTGLSCGMIFGALPAITSQWFKKRRSLAFGIMASGSSLGGTVIPIAASNLIELIGYVTVLCVQRSRLTVSSGSSGRSESSP